MNDFTGVFGDNPGSRSTRNRNTGNGNLDACRCCFRSGNLGPPPTCPPLPAANRRAACSAAPAYPLTQPTATGSVNIFDPNLQVPYSDTWTVGFQRALGTKSAIEVRYVGTRSREQWDDVQLQRGEHHRERLPRRVQARAGQPAGAHRAGLRRHRQPLLVRVSRAGHGHVAAADLPGVLQRRRRLAQAGRRRRRVHVSSNWTSSNFVNPLGAVQPEPVHAGGHERQHRPGRRPDAAGERDRGRTAGELLPRQPGHARRRQRHRQRRLHEVQLDAAAVPPPAVGRPAVRHELRARPRLRLGRTTRSACRASCSRDDRRRGRRHARASRPRRLRAAVRRAAGASAATSAR